jgi:hypothetical protein
MSLHGSVAGRRTGSCGQVTRRLSCYDLPFPWPIGGFPRLLFSVNVSKYRRKVLRFHAVRVHHGPDDRVG